MTKTVLARSHSALFLGATNTAKQLADFMKKSEKAKEVRQFANMLHSYGNSRDIWHIPSTLQR